MPDAFQPGDRVRVLSGTFVSMVGDVIGFEEDDALLGEVGGEPRPPRRFPKYIRVALPIFGKRVPITFLPDQIEKT
jgi:transcription antitermination factor NusG